VSATLLKFLIIQFVKELFLPLLMGRIRIWNCLSDRILYCFIPSNSLITIPGSSTAFTICLVNLTKKFGTFSFFFVRIWIKYFLQGKIPFRIRSKLFSIHITGVPNISCAILLLTFVPLLYQLLYRLSSLLQNKEIK
jgi:hypothetical protein